MITIRDRNEQGGYTFPDQEAADRFIEILIKSDQEHLVDPKALKEFHERRANNYQYKPKMETR